VYGIDIRITYQVQFLPERHEAERAKKPAFLDFFLGQTSLINEPFVKELLAPFHLVFEVLGVAVDNEFTHCRSELAQIAATIPDPCHFLPKYRVDGRKFFDGKGGCIRVASGKILVMVGVFVSHLVAFLC
jgi:hypothetical protein